MTDAAARVMPSSRRGEIINQIIANWSNPQYLRLHGGEMTAQEVRTVRAVLCAVRIQITESVSGLDHDN